MNWWPYSESPVLPYLLKSVILLAVVLLARVVLVRAVLRSEALTVETRRRWVLNIRNSMVLIFVTGLVFIWFHELSTFAVSLVAIAVAIVLATKELILCLSGAVLRAGTNAFTLGDRIEIQGMRGNVLDQNLLATTLLEIGPGHTSSQYTGRAVIVPNSLLLSHPVINETYMKDFVVHIMTIPLGAHDDWQCAEKLLLEIAMSECAPFLPNAQRHMKKLEGKAWLDAPSVQPRVSIQIPEPGRLNLLLRIPAPAHRTSRLEQAILRRFLLAFKGTTKERPMEGLG
ncbi:MAG: mechanosensitive ion channel family protein [Nitrospiraceae bacterium]